DRVAVAETHPGANCSVLVPEPVELRIDRVDRGPHVWVMLVGELMPELGALLAQLLDLLVDLLESTHAGNNGRDAPSIPGESSALAEAHQAGEREGGGTRGRPRRATTRSPVRTPMLKPPMWAKNAVPPPD